LVARQTAALVSAPRNPFYCSAWAEYVNATAPKQPGEYLVLVLANSQAYAPELNAEDAYPQKLAMQIRRPDLRTRVVNWSVPGAQYFDFLILMHAAQRLAADRVIWSATAAAYDDTAVPLPGRQRWASDLHLLLADPVLRARIPHDDWAPRLTPDVQRAVSLARWFPAWHWREWPASRITGPDWLVELLFRRAAWNWALTPPTKEPPRPFPIHKFNEVAAGRLLQALQGAAPHASDVLVINMPMRTNARLRSDPGWEAMAKQAGALGMRTLDLSAAIADSQFFSRAHLDARGHRALARIIAGGDL
jgi:hypothetical protein